MSRRSCRYRPLAVWAAAVLLVGCASRVHVGPSPVVEVPAEAATVVEVAFMTNRRLETLDDGLKYYSGSRGTLTVGLCRVALRDAQDNDGQLLDITPAPAAGLLSDLVEPGPGGLIVYIHGFNEDFERSCRRAALLQERLGIGGRMLLFSWPADRKYVTYASDAGDLAWSLPDFRAVLEGLAARHGDGNVTILAHSLGARATVEVLARMGQDEERAGPMFRDVVLVAPDIARSRFVSLLEAVERRAGQLTVYASEYDLALRLSSVVNTSARLGITDEEGSRSPKVQLVDVSGTGIHSLSGHVYHLHNPAVIEDIARLVGGTKAATDGAWERVAGPAPGFWQLLPVNGDRNATADEDGSGKL